MGIIHIFTETDFKKEENRKRIMKEMGLESLELCGANQIHSANIACIEKTGVSILDSVDALITTLPGTGIYMLTADCVPILVEDAENGVVAAIHAGWRGTAEQITAKTIRKIKKEYNSQPQELKVYIGPHIKSCCFEVGEEVVRGIGEKYIDGYSENNKPKINLTKANIDQLLSEGIMESNINVDSRCTCCSGLPSWRREKTADRIGSIIAITR
ncbi:MAG: peptidoglycan editing factor PgeF [Bacteroidales bacterium]|nr:peptidoglycan editing factor PgeF [Bacteroidales bacterium]